MGKYYLGLYEKAMPNRLSLKEKLKEAKKAGFDFMEISIDETEEKLARLKWDKDKKIELLKAMNETNIRIKSICLSGNRKYPLGSEDEKTRKRGMEIMSDAIDFAVDIGITTIQIAGYDEYYNSSNENTERLFAENLKKSVALAAKKGVILAFETMETPFMNTVEKAMYYVNMINSPWLKVYPDLGNITNAACIYEHTVCEDIETGKGHIVAMHLKETSPGKFREIPYGKGHVDFDNGIKMAKKLKVNVFVSEFWYVGNDDWRKQLQSANEFFKCKLDKIYK